MGIKKTRKTADDYALESSAEKHEKLVQIELNQQFLALKEQAKGIFEAVKGRRGAKNPEYWMEILSAAKVDYESGKFLMERVGANRQLDLPLVATLIQLRMQLLADIENPTASDNMLADTAILAYRNMLRVQGWVGSTSLVIERELFGQEPLETTHGYGEAMAIEQRVKHLEETLLPLLDRAQRMLIRALDRLETRRHTPPISKVSIGRATQVNVGNFDRRNG